MFETKKVVDKTQNQVNVIFPTRNEHGVWAFDDAEVGLRQEPFIGEINDMIDMFVNGATKCTIYISKDPIPDAQVHLIHSRCGSKNASWVLMNWPAPSIDWLAMSELPCTTSQTIHETFTLRFLQEIKMIKMATKKISKKQENLLKYKGREFTANYNNSEKISGLIQVERDTIYLCQNVDDGTDADNKLGYPYSYHVSEAELLDGSTYPFYDLEIGRKLSAKELKYRESMVSTFEGYGIKRTRGYFVFGCGAEKIPVALVQALYEAQIEAVKVDAKIKKLEQEREVLYSPALKKLAARLESNRSVYIKDIDPKILEGMLRLEPIK
jgi:hypothetical protein